MPDNVLIASDITVELGSAYVGSAYSPQASVTQTDTGWELTITYADPETPGELATLTIPVDSAGFGEVTASVESGHGTPQVVVTESGPDTAKEFHFAFSGIGGFSPTITVTEIEHGHRVTVTDVDGTESFDVLDGDPSQAIEDAERAAAAANAAAATADASATEADAATSAAQAATTAAQTATSTAQTATASANAATASANAAATGATSAASAAQMATTAAQAATTAADTAAGNAQDAADRANAAAAGITDAYSPLLTAGAAEGVTGGGPTDTAAWLQRTCPGTDGPASIGSIHGRTVVWNQLITHNYNQTVKGITFTSNVDGSITIAGKNTEDSNAYPSAYLADGLSTEHTYLVRGANTANAGIGAAVGGYNLFMCYDNTSSSFIRQYGNNGIIFTPDASVTGTFRVKLHVGSNGDITYNDTFYPQLFDLTTMFGAGNEPSTVAEFERMFPDAYYPYDAGSLLSVQMEGIETVGFNQLAPDRLSAIGGVSESGGVYTANAVTLYGLPVGWEGIRYISGAAYSATATITATTAGNVRIRIIYTDGTRTDGNALSAAGKLAVVSTSGKTVSNVIFAYSSGGSVSLSNICINLSSSRNGEYEPHWQRERTIPASTYFSNGMRSAGTVYDELTESAAVTRVGAVDLGTLNWSYDSTNQRFYSSGFGAAANMTLVCDKYPYVGGFNQLVDKSCCNIYNDKVGVKDSDYTTAADFKAAMSGVMLHYALATPTTTPIDPPLNLTYKAAAGGTESVTHDEPTAPPTLAITYGSTPAGIVASALAAIADPDGPTATATHAVGTYLTMGGKLYRVTTAIAIGETITPGTNITATTVMAELLALTQ